MADKFPEFRQAVDDFLALNPAPGAIIESAWFDRHLGIDKSKIVDAESATTINLLRLSRFDEFRRELLEEHHVHIESVPGKGYAVIPPEEQTECARRALATDLHRVFRRANRVAFNIDLTQLTDAQIKDNTDLRVKIAAMKRSDRRILRTNDVSKLLGKSSTPKMLQGE